MKMMRISLKIKGLTLIEMMLVVTVFAIATLATLKLVKNRAATATADSVAAQMQNVAQGVLAFYMYQSTRLPGGTTYTYTYNACSWPTTVNCSTNITLYPPNGPSLETLSPQFYAKETLCTPFLSGSSTTNCGTAAEIQGVPVTNANYFNLTLTTNSNDMAAAIASKLANAVAKNNVVTMTLTAPSQNYLINPNHGWIVSAGAITTAESLGAESVAKIGTRVALPNCGNKFEGHVIFMPFRYQTTGVAQMYWGLHIAQLTTNNTSADDGSLNAATSIVYKVLNKPDVHGNQTYAVMLGDQPDTTSSSVQHMVYYMTFCLPVGHWVASGLDQLGITGWQQDSACSTSWMDFISAVYNYPDYNTMCSNGNANPPLSFSAPIGTYNAN